MTTSHDNGIQHRRQEVHQAVKNACDQLNADGVAPRDYVEQLAWLFFLKAFDEAENQREEEAEFGDEVYRRRLNGEYRWASWANRTDRPDEMLRFVDGELWPHLRNFGIVEETGEFDADPVGEQFRRIFSSVRNHSRRGASFARVVQQVDRLDFSDQTDVIVLSELYEDLLKRVAADSRGTRESSTPRGTSSAPWSRWYAPGLGSASTTRASGPGAFWRRRGSTCAALPAR